MKQLEYSVRFNTPAFLGNAEQQAQWRTPPFKALIRQWWRVAYAEAHDYRVKLADMRHDEGMLFGHAWLDDDRDARGQKVAARKSEVRIRLDKWEDGQETKAKWGQQDPFSQKVPHPEVGKIGPLLYLGYGPLDAQKVTKPGQNKPEYLTVLKHNAAIQAGESATLSIALPDEHAPHIERALWLMDRYATAGGRSRNGWGSFALLPLPPGEGRGEGATLIAKTPLRPWRDCLNLDWPHVIGQDDHGALIWQTRPFDDWKALMRELAVVKIGLRTQFVFTTGKNADHPDARHWLSHPVTNHNVAAWKERGRGDFRLPNSLRFKVRKTPEGKFVGVIFHVPCLPPPEFKPDRHVIESVWQRVHTFLDAPAQHLTRTPA